MKAWGNCAYFEFFYSRLPYAELNEPFAAYYDATNNRSRVDFYGDIVQTFQRGDVGKYGTTFKVAYMTNHTHYNFRRCFQTNGGC